MLIGFSRTSERTSVSIWATLALHGTAHELVFHCLLNGDTVVLDSEWHWLFNCVHFHELRHKRPFLQETLKSIQRKREFADICDLGNLFMMIQNDSRLGFSVASFIRQAILERKSWMRDVCVQCRPCTPPDHWNRITEIFFSIRPA